LSINLIWVDRSLFEDSIRQESGYANSSHH
jgi:hypothetical protein